MATEHEILRTQDLQPDEWTRMRQMSQEAALVRGYLHVEIRKAKPNSESRFWIVTTTNPDISEAVGQPVVGLVDEVAGGVVAYVTGPEDRAQALADVLNGVVEVLNPLLNDAQGAIAKRMGRYTRTVVRA